VSSDWAEERAVRALVVREGGGGARRWPVGDRTFGSAAGLQVQRLAASPKCWEQVESDPERPDAEHRPAAARLVSAPPSPDLRSS
jgi:hypothetical protein